MVTSHGNTIKSDANPNSNELQVADDKSRFVPSSNFALSEEVPSNRVKDSEMPDSDDYEDDAEPVDMDIDDEIQDGVEVEERVRT